MGHPVNKTLAHQVIFMKDIDQAELGYLLEFIYLGEVSVPKGELYYFFYFFIFINFFWP